MTAPDYRSVCSMYTGLQISFFATGRNFTFLYNNTKCYHTGPRVTMCPAKWVKQTRYNITINILPLVTNSPTGTPLSPGLSAANCRAGAGTRHQFLVSPYIPNTRKWVTAELTCNRMNTEISPTSDTVLLRDRKNKERTEKGMKETTG
jgi:hypothetical protein